MGERDCVAIRRLKPFQGSLRPCADLIRGLTTRTAIAPEHPIRVAFPDFWGCQTLVVPVVPLAQVLRNLRAVTESGELAGFPGPEQGADEDKRKRPLAEDAGKRGRALAAGFGQGQIGPAGVLAGDTPLGLAVANDHNLAPHDPVLDVAELGEIGVDAAGAFDLRDLGEPPDVSLFT